VIHNRRSFLRCASLAAAGSSLALRPFGNLSALAQSAGGYKAMVCIFLLGGNDSNNMLIPGDPAGYANYAGIRGPLAIGQGSLLPLQGQPSLMLSSMLPYTQSLFNSGAVALVANVGSLVAPTTQAQYLAGSVASPLNLFSHEDQQTMWQTANPVATGTTGWAGRVADSLALGTLNVPMAISVSGSTVFTQGAQTSGMTVTPGTAGALSCTETVAVCNARLTAAQQLLTFNSGVTLIQADDTITANGYSYSNAMNRALSSAPKVNTSLGSANPLKTQIEQILQIISVRNSLGAQRQIFFASLEGFDTHGAQLPTHNALLQNVDAALGILYQQLGKMGLANEVTTFTMSEFNRVLEPNSAAGSDHGWGGHAIVMGGAVKGGNIYGTYPTLELGGPNDCDVNGRWIPTTSTSQFAATLASWFGVSAANLPVVLPYLSNFTTQNLGFV